MNLWLVKLNPGLPDRAAKISLKNYCVAQGLMFMGWRFADEAFTTVDDFLSFVETKWRDEIRAAKRACENYFKAKKGDICLLRGADGKHYIGKVQDDAPFWLNDISNSQCKWLTHCSWGRKVKWLEIGNLGSVPPNIAAQLAARNARTIDIRKSTILKQSAELLWKRVNGETLAESDFIVISQETFARELFDARLLEDLVGIYIQKKKQAVFVPSSCKTSTQKYEFYLLSFDGKEKYYVQTKNQERINILDHQSDDGIVYLFSGIEHYEPIELKDNPPQNMIILTAKELYEFVKNNMELFPHIDRHYKLT